MVRIGVHSEGFHTYPLQKLDNGYVVPDVSISEIHEYNREMIKNQIEMGISTEKYGYDYVLHPENHFKLIGKNSPAPLEVQTSIASQTRHVRLVQMANILPWRDPLRLAERLGTLDTISDGRLEVGIGTGSGPREIGLFTDQSGMPLTDREINWDVFVECFEILIRSWTENYFDYHGEWFDIPSDGFEWENEHERQYLETNVSGVDASEYVTDDGGTTTLESISVFPQPVQDPHPQIWKPIGSKRSAKWAALFGINGCTVGIDFSAVRNLIDAYTETAEEAGWPDHRPEYDGDPFDSGWDQKRDRGIMAQVPVFNTDRADDAAFERFKLGQEFLLSIQQSPLSPEQGEESPIDGDEFIRQNDAPIVGDTEEIIDQLATFTEVCGYEELTLFLTPGAPGMKQEDKLTQMQVFAEEVVPYFTDA